MPSYSTHEVVLIRYPFSDLSATKIRPGVIVSAAHPSRDLLIVPFTSRIEGLLPGEFVLRYWAAAGLNLETAVKRGIYTVEASLVLKSLGRLAASDANEVEQSLRNWLGL